MSVFEIEGDRWYEAAETARILGISGATLRRWAQAGKIDFLRTLGSATRPGYRRYLGNDILMCWLEIHGTFTSEGGEKSDRARSDHDDPGTPVPPV